MSENPEKPDAPRHRPWQEFQDPHYHDEDEVSPPDDDFPAGKRPPAGPRRFPRNPPQRRDYGD